MATEQGAKKQIKRALISVFNKDGLEEILSLLATDGVKFLSTGGTRSFIEQLGYACDAVENLTGYPSILGGRVKTLHPKVFGGILSRRDSSDDARDTTKFSIPDIDLVIVDLYPFEATVAEAGATKQDIIEKIDIGGISLIRAAAKNCKDVAIVASKNQYGTLLSILKEQGAATTVDQRAELATEAFLVTSHYDTAIGAWFKAQTCDAAAGRFTLTAAPKMPLRYGENPHQKADYYGDFSAMFDQLHGKEVSYNNLLDIDSAENLLADLGALAPDKAAAVVLKHNNACGAALRGSAPEAWKDALAGDPVSAFGGIIAFNCTIDAETAEDINRIFFEVIIAPEYTPEALAILQQKKNRIILLRKAGKIGADKVVRSCLGGVLVQQRDTHVEATADLEPMTQKNITDDQTQDLLFANVIVKHSKSNAIVLAKGQQLIGSGVGQTSRVDALKQAIAKARAFEFDLDGAVMASDAFFPFADCVEIAYKAGIRAAIQPGGSVRDNESVEFCDKNGMAMVKTGYRHFRH